MVRIDGLAEKSFISVLNETYYVFWKAFRNNLNLKKNLPILFFF